uniref:Uncharacterized protein n=1 Tax=Arundo donax TaxID=35708 RepID=A0A0A9FVF4_ARUDO
MLKIYLQCPYK